MSSKIGSRPLLATALAGLLALGTAGCAQERLTVTDTCAEYNAIVNGGDRTAEETASMLKDLEGRVSPAMEEHWASATDFFERGGNGVAEMSEADREADQFFSGQCRQEGN